MFICLRQEWLLNARSPQKRQCESLAPYIHGKQIVRCLSVLLFWFFHTVGIAQLSVRIVPEKSGIRYATFSPDEKYLVISQLHDTIRVFDAKTLAMLRLITFKSPENGIRAWEEIGKPDFAVTEDRLVYVSREFKGDSALIWLNAFDIPNGLLTGKIRIGGYRQPDYSSFDIMPAYSIAKRGSSVMISLEDQLFEFDPGSSRITGNWKISGAADLSVAPDGKQMAMVMRDSLVLRDPRSGKRKWSLKTEAASVGFVNDTLLMVMGKEAVLFDLKRKRISDTLIHPFTRVTQVSVSGGMLAASGSGYYDRGAYAAAYAIRPLQLRAIFHLPARFGFNTLISRDNRMWCVLSDGRLFRFDLSDDQDPRPVSQRGHKADIRSIRFSADGRQMISTERGGDIIVWDVPTGRTIDRYITGQSLLNDAFFASGQDIIYNGFRGYRRIHRSVVSNTGWGLQFNTYSDHVSEKEALVHQQVKSADSATAAQMVVRYQTDPESAAAISSEYFVGMMKTDGLYRMRVVRLKSGAVEDRPIPENLVAVWRSDALVFYDDHTLVLRGAQSTIVFYDIRTGQVVRRFGGKYQNLGQVFNGVQKLIFSPAGDSLFAVTDQRVIQGWDLRSGQRFLKLDTRLTGLTQDQAMEYKNGYLTLFNENSNIQFVAAVHLASGRGKMIAYLDTAFQKRVQLVDLAAHKARGIPVKASLSPDARQMLILRQYYIDQQRSEVYLDLWDLDQMKVVLTTRVPDLKFSEWSVSWELKMAAVWDVNATNLAEQKKMRAEFGDNTALGGLNTHPGVKLINFDKGKVQALNLDKLNIYRVGDVVFLNPKELWLRDDFYSTLHKISLASGKITVELKPDGSDASGTVGDYFRFSGSDLYYALAPDAFHTTTDFARYSLAENRAVAHGTSGGPRIMAMSAPHPSGVVALGYDDHSISVRDTRTLDEKYRIVQNEAGEFVIVTGERYYMADRTSANSVFFNWKNRSVALSQFDALYNRPDKVLQAMGFLDEQYFRLLEKAAGKRGRLAGGETVTSGALASLPEVKIDRIRDVPIQTAADRLTLSVSGRSANDPLSSWQVKVNGVPVFGSAGKALSGKKAFQETAELLLSSGANVISVSVRSATGVESIPDEVTVTSTAPKIKPKLYLAAIAINEYQNPGFNLKYAVKDARDIIRFFSASAEFSGVFVDSVFNQRVSLENIRALRERLRKAGPDDRVIVFVAGHGMLDENFDFRFGAWNVDMDHPMETGILYDELDRLLDGIQCRNKIMLIDACHSGQVDKEEIRATAEDLVTRQSTQGRVVQRSFKSIQHNVFKSGLVDRRGFELMQEIFYGLGSVTGAQVVVATAGDSYAQESAEWNNGVFTYSLLSGLKSGEADLNGDTSVTTDELVSYLRDKVKELTNGDQVPRFREENRLNHFGVWRVR